MTRLMADAAHCAQTLPPGVSVVAGYLPGATAELHAWSPEDWRRHVPPAGEALPIWVASNLSNALGEAADCVRQLVALGVPAGVAVCVDIETNAAEDPRSHGYASLFAQVLNRAGYILIVYSSREGVARVGAGGWQWWVADPTGAPHTLANAAGVQFEWGEEWDLSLLDDTLPLWQLSTKDEDATMKLNKPVVAFTSSPSGHGYVLVAADGGVFAFGDAEFCGSAAGETLAAPVVAVGLTNSGKGYWLVGADGGVFAFGDAPFLGSVPGLPDTPAQPATVAASSVRLAGPAPAVPSSEPSPAEKLLGVSPLV